MEPNIAISLGSELTVFGVFFAVNRDSKKSSADGIIICNKIGLP